MSHKNYLGGELSPWQSSHDHPNILFSATSYRFSKTHTETSQSPFSPWSTSKSFQKHPPFRKKNPKPCINNNPYINVATPFKSVSQMPKQKNLSTLTKMHITVDSPALGEKSNRSASKWRRDKKIFTLNFMKRLATTPAERLEKIAVTPPMTSKSVFISALLRRHCQAGQGGQGGRGKEVRAYSVFL